MSIKVNLIKTNNLNFNDTHVYNKKHLITNNLTNYITKRNNINHSEHNLNRLRKRKKEKTVLRIILSQMLSEVIMTTLEIIYTRNMIIEPSIKQKM